MLLCHMYMYTCTCRVSHEFIDESPNVCVRISATYMYVCEEGTCTRLVNG